MDEQTYRGLVLSMAGATLELTRQILQMAHENLRVNTETLQAVTERNEYLARLTAIAGNIQAKFLGGE